MSVESAPPLDAEAWAGDSTRKAAREVLRGRRRGIAALLPFAGPAFVTSVAYVDPGNFATNIQAGSGFGYRLLWVVVIANLMAMLFQGLSAKLGVVTGMNLAQLCRRHAPPPLTTAMWIVSEIGAMATDLAELLGATLALYLLFHVPMAIGVVVVACVTYVVLSLQRYGFRSLEFIIGALVGVIAISYGIETVLSAPDWRAIAVDSVVPWVGGTSSALLAVGIVGATVMPHAIYLHSALTQRRIVPVGAFEARRITGFSNLDVVVALGIAGVVNMAMMYMAAAVFHDHGRTDVADISVAYQTLMPLLGNAAALIFLLALLASGISSSVVGTMAGQVIMQGFVGFTVPLWLRRVVTLAPAVVVIALGVDVTRALVMSQVVLSFVLPVPIIALIVFTSRAKLMGPLRNTAHVTCLAVAAGIVILALNAILVWTAFGFPLAL